MTRKKPFKFNKNEILYNLINSGIAGALVFFGSLADGKITLQGVGVALAASAVVAIIKFKEYWDGERREYMCKLFVFI